MRAAYLPSVPSENSGNRLGLKGMSERRVARLSSDARNDSKPGIDDWPRRSGGSPRIVAFGADRIIDAMAASVDAVMCREPRMEDTEDSAAAKYAKSFEETEGASCA
ncbi:hypothetical protein PC120_g27476 [Phytophthora cactorum]|nr:hypothetical protein PC120_g27476 [Phytophthora cactorum]